MKIYIGIDPGKTGGLCIITGDTLTSVKWNDDMAYTLRQLSEHDCFAVIESQHAFPEQGVTSTFTFGENYGEWIGMLKALKIPFVRVSPSKWMKHFGNFSKIKSQRKHELLKLAKERYPKSTIPLYIADAVMISIYAMEVYNNI